MPCPKPASAIMGKLHLHHKDMICLPLNFVQNQSRAMCVLFVSAFLSVPLTSAIVLSDKPFFCLARYCPVGPTHHNASIHSTTAEHLGGTQLEAVINNVAVYLLGRHEGKLISTNHGPRSIINA